MSISQYVVSCIYIIVTYLNEQEKALSTLKFDYLLLMTWKLKLIIYHKWILLTNHEWKMNLGIQYQKEQKEEINLGTFFSRQSRTKEISSK